MMGNMKRLCFSEFSSMIALAACLLGTVLSACSNDSDTNADVIASEGFVAADVLEFPSNYDDMNEPDSALEDDISPCIYDIAHNYAPDTTETPDMMSNDFAGEVGDGYADGDARPEDSAGLMDTATDSSSQNEDSSTADAADAPPMPVDPDGAWRVMTFNLRTAFGDDTGQNLWANRIQRVVETVATHYPDVMGTQEGYFFQNDAIIEALPAYAWVGVPRTGEEQWDEICAIHYRTDLFELVDTATFALSDTPDQLGTKFSDVQCCPRVTTWVHLKRRKNGEGLFVFNAHWDQAEVKDVHWKSAKLSLQMIDAIAGDAPAFLIGDFNEGAGDDSWRILTGDLTYENTAGDLEDPWTVLGLTEAGTFHGFDGIAGTSRIDWLLHTKDVVDIEAFIVSDDFDGYYPSDHFPVFGRFSTN